MKIGSLILVAGLAMTLTTQAAVTISGNDLSQLTYRPSPAQDPGTYSQYVGGPWASPPYAWLATADAGPNGEAPVVYVRANSVSGLPTLGTLSGLSGSYSLFSSSTPAGTQPYWLTYLNDPNGGYVGVVSMGGPTLNASTPIHVFYDFSANPSSSDTHWGLTLGQLYNTAYGSTTFGQMSVFETGIEIGNWAVSDTLGADARISSITLDIAPVPEPSTIAAAALLLLPFGVSTLRILRRKSTL